MYWSLIFYTLITGFILIIGAIGAIWIYFWIKDEELNRKIERRNK